MDYDCLNNEQGILTQVADNDQRAFAALMDHYAPVIYSHVLSYLKSAARAEEITQDIFLQIWKHRKELPGIRNFSGYIYVITRNKSISAFREKLQKWEESDKDELEVATPDPQRAIELRELSSELQKAINLLPPRRKQVFTMSRLEGMSYEEIARELGISKSAVNQHIVEALVFLRTYLRNQLPLILIIGLHQYFHH